MGELFRTLGSVLLMWYSLLAQGGFSPFATPTKTPTLVPTRTATSTRTHTPIPTRTLTPTPRPQGESDPLGVRAAGDPPAQTLPSAVLIYPLIRTSATSETRIEMMNMTSFGLNVQCFYVTNTTCNEIGFFISLTPSQPISWLASTGVTGNGARVAPPFGSSDGELKCFVRPSSPDLSFHNALQGRALLSNTAGETIGYTAIGFRRLSPGTFTGLVSLDGFTYEECPDRLHFNVLSQQSGVNASDSELILVPCTQDLVNQVSSVSTIQYAVINDFEQSFSGSNQLRCMERRRFSTIPALRKSSIGTDTAHLILRSIDVPVVGFVVNRFAVSGGTSVSSNDPYLEGTRSATINVPGDD